MKSHSLFLAPGLFLVGGLVGWSLAPSAIHDSDSGSSHETAITKSSRSGTTSSRSRGRVPGNTQMRAIRDSKNESDRTQAAIALARSLPLDQAGKWLDEGLFNQRKGYALTLFTKILEKRWRTDDPDSYLVWQLGNGKGVSKEEMARIAESNPDLLLVSIRLIEDTNLQGKALANLARVRPDLALAELGKMNVANLQNSGAFYSIFREVAKNDLAALQASVEGLPFVLQEQARKVVYGERLSQDFAGTLAQLIDEPDGLAIISSAYDALRKNRTSFLESFNDLPKAWKSRLESDTHSFTYGMEHNEILSTDWESYGFSKKVIGQLKGSALFSKVRGKEGALGEFQNANLDEGGRRYFLDMLSWNGGEKTIQELLPNLEPADRDYISKNMENNNGSRNPARKLETAADLSEELAIVDRQSFQNFSSSMRNWNAGQRAQFQNDYAAMEGEERHRITAVLTMTDDLELRTAAVGELLENPEAQKVAGWGESSGATAASRLAVELLKKDADRATTWVSGLPEGDSRAWAMKNLAANWKNYDPEAAETWVDSLPATEQQDVRAFLENPGN